MRTFNIAVAMTFAASFAYAQQELSLDNDDLDHNDDEPDLDLIDFDEEEEQALMQDERGLRSLRRKTCMEKATGPEFWCWLRSDAYQALTRQEKLE